MKNSPSSRRRLLVISTTGMGDCLMGTPALRALRESFPQAGIDVLVNARRREILSRNPHIDRLLGYRNNSLSRALLLLKNALYRYDAVLVFHANEDLWKILRLVRYRVCYNRQNYRNPRRRVFPLESLPRHSIQKRLALVERVDGKNTGNYRYEYSVPAFHRQWAGEQLRRREVSEQTRILGLQLGAADLFKCWPVEYFAETARYLQSRFGMKVYLNVSRREKSLADRFVRIFGSRDVLLNPEEGISYAAAFLERCSLLLTPDTGPMHLAIALGIPLLGLFCPTELEETGPLECESAVVIRKARPCRPCLRRDCRENFCMKQIGVEEVCAAAERILKKRPAGGVPV